MNLLCGPVTVGCHYEKEEREGEMCRMRSVVSTQ